jgi:hypothetical protein
MTFKEEVATRILERCISERGDDVGPKLALRMAQNFADAMCKEWGHQFHNHAQRTIAHELPENGSCWCERCERQIVGRAPVEV